jgi:hypothetical protein
MITKTKTKNSDLVELFGEMPRSSELNKQKLITMAKNGEDRPNKKTKLGNLLCNYICKFSGTYDKEFDKLIRKLAPNWFIGKEKKQKQLIQIAKSGKAKPGWKTSLGASLRAYTYAYEKNLSYDPVFDKLIRKLRPDWFITQTQTAEEKKKKLILMAKNGAKRPNQKKSELGNALCAYTTKTSETYCEKFDKLIRKIAPSWFVSRTQIAEETKKLLIQMARIGVKRQLFSDSKLGKALVFYTKKNCSSYCPVFDKTIRKIAPSWFVSRSEITKENKKQLIKMAKNGEPRPGQNTNRLGRRLTSYTCKSSESYDSVFDKIIRKIRPDWFRS